jgi:hypothetical protein
MTSRSSLALIAVLILALLVPAAVTARSPIAVGLTSGDANLISAVDAATRRFGRKPALWSLLVAWGSRDGQVECPPDRGRCAFPTAMAGALRDRGIMPLIWWRPMGLTTADMGKYARYQLIIEGRHDAYIRQWAKDAKAFGSPVIVRFAHEMNGTWFPWGIDRFDNTPARFVAAWRHIWTIVREEVGATNVRFLWSTIREKCDGCVKVPFEDFYPGNEYVDYVGMSAYNWVEPTWKTLPEIVAPTLAGIERATGDAGKPFILAEVASHYLGGSKGAWIRDGFQQVYTRWPEVVAIVYTDVDMRKQGHPDWRLRLPLSGAAENAFKAVIRLDEFRGRLR